MNEIDFRNLDGKVLRTFLTILEESSVSRAADRLGITQSAVSHSLSKLRRILQDPLFVRSGQGLIPTERATALRDPVQKVLDGMKGLTDARPFDPQAETLHFRVAANDLQRELIFPDLYRDARADGIDVVFDFAAAGVPGPDILRGHRCDLMITPLPPDGPDIIQKRLTTSPMVVYYDATRRKPPTSWADYCNTEHVEVRFPDGRSAQAALRGVDLGRIRQPTVTLPHFNAIPAFVRGTTLISTDTLLMRFGPLAGLDHAPLPFDCPPVTFYMVWHERSNSDPAHRWLRERVQATAARMAR